MELACGLRIKPVPVRARTVWGDEACDCFVRPTEAETIHKRRGSRSATTFRCRIGEAGGLFGRDIARNLQD